MSYGDIELDEIRRRHTELDGQIGESTPLVPSKTKLVVSWLILLFIFGAIGSIALAVVLL